MRVQAERDQRDLHRNSFDGVAGRRHCPGYRKRILNVSRQVTALHVAPALSCIEITDLIHNHRMRRELSGEYRDVFLMSKGHGCMVQ
jgi:transketolase